MAVAEKRPTRSERSQSTKTERALADVVSGKKSSAEALAELLNGSSEPTATGKLRPPRKPRPQAKTATTSGKALRVVAGGKKPSAPRVPKVDLPEALKKRLKGSTPEQHQRVRAVLGYDGNATFKAPDSDGDIVAEYVPKWEQGRMKNGEFVKGPGRRFVYLIDRGGHLSGHGFKYRSTAAEAKLKPLEEKNAARLAREAKKVAA